MREAIRDGKVDRIIGPLNNIATPDTIGSAMDVKTAIGNGDAEALRTLLVGDSSRANALICWGNDDRIRTHPLHYASDLFFNKDLSMRQALAIVGALIEAGADLDFQVDGKGDTPLIGAASLGAEDVGLALLDAGAESQLRGIFGETALHWAAMLGEDRLVNRLVERSDLNLKDKKYNSPPLGWAIHGYFNPPAGNKGEQREVVALLVAAGARVESEWLESEQVRADAALLAALRANAI